MWTQMPYGHHGWDSGWDGGWFMLLHGSFWLLFLILIVFGVVLLVRSLAGRADPAPRTAAQPEALAILDARYARGEVERDEYLARRQDLTGHA